MKRLFLLTVFAVIFCCKDFAQAKMPDFVIADIKGQYHKVNTQSIRKQVLLIYFIPDCGDCQAFTAKLTKDARLFKKYQIIMVTNAGLSALKKFAADFQLKNKQNLLIGTEGWTATLLRTIRAEHFPYAATYTAKGLLLHVFANPNDVFK